MKKDSRIIQVSFKKTTRDIKIYSYVNALEEMSDFVKDALEVYIKKLDCEGRN
ncbi:MAG TPA: hypothetical protein VIM70_06500 [Clostridium sp.]|uniref:hypothetical protein n=1 Tax=Clostridium sp. TaxID=1506 RepID=UPI002F94184D